MLHYYGSAILRDMPSAAVCSSRQSAYPLGSHAWVQATVAAVRACAERQSVLITSEGMATWELALARAAAEGVAVIIVPPKPVGEPQRYIEELSCGFRLPVDRIGVACPAVFPSAKKDRLAVRDLTVLALADTIYPISIKDKGNMATLLEQYAARIDDTFRIRYNLPHPSNHLPPSMRLHPDWSDGDWLVHFTRAARAPWPGRTKYDFYDAMVASDDEYCQSARLALLRILSGGSILASRRGRRGARPTIAFTELSNEVLAHLFRFRPRLSTTSVEPWGVAVPKGEAARLGIRPVIYGDDDMYRSLPQGDRPYFQSRGRGGMWRHEHEWRRLEDLDITALPTDATRIVIPTATDISAMADMTGWKVTPLFAESDNSA